MEEIVKESLLYDFYGCLLSERQREVLDLHNEENLSLAEIAEGFGISRSAVHDSLKKGEKALLEYEEKMGLLGKFQKREAAKEKIERELESGIAQIDGDPEDGTSANELREMLTRITAEIEAL